MESKNIVEKRAEVMIRDLIVIVTNRCNHKCAMCYYHNSINQNINELTEIKFKRISSSLGKIEHLMISGGEPFLRKDLPSICKIFTDNNPVRSLFIPTNGSNPEIITSSISQILEMIPKIELTIMLTLDGRQITHDLIHGKQGAFRSVLKTIEELNLLRFKLLKKKQFFSLCLNTVVTTQNIDEVLPLMDYVKKNTWVDFHTFSPMRGAGWNPDYQPPSGRSFEKLFHQAKPYFKFYACRSSFSKERKREVIKRINERYRLWIHLLNGGRLPFVCQAGNYIGVLEPDGGVRLCELKPIVGNVRDTQYDFSKVWFSEKANSIRKTIPNCACTHACFINASEKYLK